MKRISFLSRIAIMFILLTLTACEKCCWEQVEIVPTISWKIGQEYNALDQNSYFMIEFSCSDPDLQEVRFKSLWAFQNGAQEMLIHLESSDFNWASNHRGVLTGKAKTSVGTLLIEPSFIHKGTILDGHFKVRGKWYSLPKKTLP